MRTVCFVVRVTEWRVYFTISPKGSICDTEAVLTRVVGSPLIQIPPDLDRDGVEHHRQRVERLLAELTVEAEAWAERGGRYENQIDLRREGMPLHNRRAA